MLMNIELIEHGCLGYRLLCLPDGTVIKPFPEPGATIQKSRDSLAVQSPILPGRLFTLHERMVILLQQIKDFIPSFITQHLEKPVSVHMQKK